MGARHPLWGVPRVAGLGGEGCSDPLAVSAVGTERPGASVPQICHARSPPKLRLTVEETEVRRGEVTLSKENKFPKRTLRSGR